MVDMLPKMSKNGLEFKRKNGKEMQFLSQERIQELKIYGRGGLEGINLLRDIFSNVHVSLRSLRHLTIFNNGDFDFTEQEGHILLQCLSMVSEISSLETLTISNVPSWFKDEEL